MNTFLVTLLFMLTYLFFLLKNLIVLSTKDRNKKVNRLRGLTIAIGCGTMALLNKC